MFSYIYVYIYILQVKHNGKLLAENGSERLNHLVKAFCAEDRTSALASISQAKPLAAWGNKLLQSVKRYQVIIFISNLIFET